MGPAERDQNLTPPPAASRFARLCLAGSWLAALAVPAVPALVQHWRPAPPAVRLGDALDGIATVLHAAALAGHGWMLLMAMLACAALCLLLGLAAALLSRRGVRPVRWRTAMTPAILAAVLLLGSVVVSDAQARTPAPGHTMQTNPSPTPQLEALQRAIDTDDVERALSLLPGTDPHSRDVLGRTLLHRAASASGDPRLLDALLRAGVPVGARDHDDRNALHVALLHARYARSADGTGGRRLRAAVDQLLAHGGELAPEPARATPDAPSLLAALLLQPMDPSLLQLLLQRGLPVPDEAVLKAVSATETPEGVERALIVLQHAGAAQLRWRDAEGQTAVHKAARQVRRMPLLEALARRGADLHAADRNGRTALAEAAGNNNLAALDWLAARGLATATTDAEGQTPLHDAARDPRADTLRWLLARGADLQARDRQGRRALDIAIDSHRYAYRSAEERLALAQLLGGSAADTARGRIANHPLHRAIRAYPRDLRRVQELLEQGADANVRDESGQAPLQFALVGISRLPNAPEMQDYCRRLLPLLLRHGADPQRVHDTWKGTTYLDEARKLGVLDDLQREMRRSGR